MKRIIILILMLLPALAFGQTRPSVLQIKTVESIADLKLITPTATGTYAVTQGYSSILDNGGGTFFWDVSSVATSDDGVVVNPTGNAGAGRWIRQYNGMANLKWFGSIGDGSDNLAEIFNRVVDGGNVDTILIPAGQYNFNVRPHDIERNMVILGEGKQDTIIYKNYTTTNDADGIFNLRAGAKGSKIDGMELVGGTGYTGGCLISLIASTTESPDYSTLSNLYLTSGAATIDTSIYLNGEARSTGSPGLRDINIRGCQVFGAASASIYAKSVVALNISQVDTFKGNGVSAKIQIDGTPSVKSYYVNIDAGSLDGLDLEYLLYGQFRCALIFDIAATSNVEYCMLNGNLARTGSTSVSLNWVESFWINNAIIEHFSDADGEFTRFADGTMIITHDIDIVGADTASGNIFISATDTTWLFPYDFIAAPVVTGSVNNTGRAWLNAYNTTATQTQLIMFTGVTTGAGPFGSKVTAVGRYK